MSLSLDSVETELPPLFSNFLREESMVYVKGKAVGLPVTWQFTDDGVDLNFTALIFGAKVDGKIADKIAAAFRMFDLITHSSTTPARRIIGLSSVIEKSVVPDEREHAKVAVSTALPMAVKLATHLIRWNAVT